jgi:hypothetical protein
MFWPFSLPSCCVEIWRITLWVQKTHLLQQSYVNERHVIWLSSCKRALISQLYIFSNLRMINLYQACTCIWKIKGMKTLTVTGINCFAHYKRKKIMTLMLSTYFISNKYFQFVKIYFCQIYRISNLSFFSIIVTVRAITKINWFSATQVLKNPI